jgi:hypothetical protein
MSKMASNEPFGHLQHKLWSKERLGVKLAVWLPTTKSRESTRPRCGVRHTVGKLLRRATSLLQTSSQSEVWAGSYELPKSRESKPRQFRDSSLGVPGIKAIWMQVQLSNVENTIWGEVVASPESGLWRVKWVRVACGLSQHQRCFLKVN